MKALITGGTSGIGFGVAQQLSDCGWDIIIVGRNIEKGTDIARELKAHFICADLSLMSDVHQLAQQINTQLDALILCAGIVSLDQKFVLTREGLEKTFATNYLSRFALSQMLLPRLNLNARIVMVSGNGKYNNVSTDWFLPEGGINSAFKAALAVDLYAEQLARHRPDIQVHTCYPGWVRTNIMHEAILPIRAMMWLLGIPVKKGSSYITRLVIEQHQDIHWLRDEPFSPNLPEDAAQSLWDFSEKNISTYL